MNFSQLIKKERDGQPLAIFSERIGFSHNAIAEWEREDSVPRPSSIRRLGKALNWDDDFTTKWLDRFENARYKNPKEIEMGSVRRVLRKPQMDIIREIEAEFGSIGNCPNTHPLMQKIHAYLGVKAKVDDFDKEKVEKLRTERRLQKKELSEDLGYVKSWYHDFQGDKVFTIEYAEMLADYFEVSVEEFEFDEGLSDD